jgi:hypothetical protein
MKDRGLCAVAGRFFGTEAYARVFRDGQADLCSEYWDLIGGILSAAHLYRQALDQQSASRSVRERELAEPELAAAGSEELPPQRILEEYAGARGMRCPQCQGLLNCRSFHAAGDDEDHADVEFECHDCRHPVRLSIESRDFDRWLRDPE